jgi:hypothetical protein
VRHWIPGQARNDVSHAVRCFAPGDRAPRPERRWIADQASLLNPPLPSFTKNTL